MHHRFWVFMLLAAALMIAVMPAGAQDSVSPAELVPANIAAYIEVQTGAEADFREIVRILARLTDDPNPEAQVEEITLENAVAQILPGVDYNEAVAPWLGETIGFAAFTGEASFDFAQGVMIAPASDPAALASSRDALVADLTELSTQGEATIYELASGSRLAVLPNAVVLGTPDEVEAVLAVQAGAPSLARNDAFNNVWAALPADAPMKFSFSGEELRAEARPEDLLNFSRTIEILFRINPVTSEMEQALLTADWFGGFGGAIALVDNRLDFTGVYVINAQYAAPTLPTDSAGAALFPYIPGDAVLVLDSYDATSVIMGVGGVVLLGPAIQNVFDSIVTQLENPSMTPPPTPTPRPTPTVDEIFDEQIEPLYTQVEAFVGTDIEELFSLLSGEYALAIFGGLEGTLMGSDTMGLTAGLWLQTSDPERVIELLDTSLERALAMAGGSNAPERREETLNNRQVVIWSDPTMGDVIAYGILSDDVVFLTVGETAPIITQAALGDGVLPQSATFPGDLIESWGSGQEGVLYMDANTMGMLYAEPTLSKLESLVVSVDAQANGVFVMHLAMTPAE